MSRHYTLGSLLSAAPGETPPSEVPEKPMVIVGFVLAALLASPATTALPADDDRVEIELSGEGVAYERVVYELRARGRSCVVRRTQHLGGTFGVQEAVGLWPREQLDGLLDALGEVGAMDLPSTRLDSRVGPVTTYDVTIRRGGLEHRFAALNPEVHVNPRYRAVIALVRAAVETAVGPTGFSDGRVRAGEAGFLRLKTDRPARVRIDGVEFGLGPPFDGLKLVAGTHLLETLPTAGGRAQRFEITIDRGKTTSLQLTLE